MKILNIGSLNIDKTYSMNHFVQPKETASALDYQEFCGGKGLNQSVALARAGAEVYHCGAVGPDGSMLLRTLEDAGAHTEYVRQVEGASGHAVIQLDATGQNNIIIWGGANQMVTREQIDGVLAQFGPEDLMLVQNETSNVDYAIAQAKARGMKVAFNPSPVNDQLKRCDVSLVDYLLLNEIEGQVLAGCDSEEPETIIEGLRKRFPDTTVILTLGEAGSCLFDRGQRLNQKIYAVRPVDTTGAGDTYCGYFLFGLAMGWDFGRILELASAASAISVTRKGASQSVPVLTEVQEFLAAAKQADPCGR